MLRFSVAPVTRRTRTGQIRRRGARRYVQFAPSCKCARAHRLFDAVKRIVSHVGDGRHRLRLALCVRGRGVSSSHVTRPASARPVQSPAQKDSFDKKRTHASVQIYESSDRVLELWVRKSPSTPKQRILGPRCVKPCAASFAKVRSRKETRSALAHSHHCLVLDGFRRSERRLDKPAACRSAQAFASLENKKKHGPVRASFVAARIKKIATPIHHQHPSFDTYIYCQNDQRETRH